MPVSIVSSYHDYIMIIMSPAMPGSHGLLLGRHQLHAVHSALRLFSKLTSDVTDLWKIVSSSDTLIMTQFCPELTCFYSSPPFAYV